MRVKMSKQPPPAPTASTIGPCPTVIQVSRTPQHWKFTQHLRTTRPPHCPTVIKIVGRPGTGSLPSTIAPPYHPLSGWSGGAMVLGELPVPGCPTIWITVGQGPIALAVGAGGVVWTFFLSSSLSPLSPSLWETARYRLKYCLKGPLNPKQPTNYHPL